MKKFSKYTAAQKLEHAELAMAKQDIDAARECMRDACELAPEDAEVLDALGALLAEHGPHEEAIKVLRQAVEVSPDDGYEKYMYLGQLVDDADSVSNFERGIHLLRRQSQHLVSSTSVEFVDKLRQWQEVDEEGSAALAEALCSLAEAHLNYSDATEVSSKVEELLQEAQTLDTSNPQPLQVLASLRVEQGRPEKALALLHQSMKLWYAPHPDSTASRAAAERGPPPVEPPSYEFRLESVKLLLELEDTIETASEVLQDLIDEDDRVVETWYLFAMCLLAGGEHAEARTALERGQALAKTAGMPFDDPLWVAFEDTKADIQKSG